MGCKGNPQFIIVLLEWRCPTSDFCWAWTRAAVFAVVCQSRRRRAAEAAAATVALGDEFQSGQKWVLVVHSEYAQCM